MFKLPTKLVEDPILRQPLPRVAIAPPPAPAKPLMPPDLEREIATYCQKQIGRWKETDARTLLGHPIRQRPAYDEKRSVNGVIYAFTADAKQGRMFYSYTNRRLDVLVDSAGKVVSLGWY
jgi:hypothetical protein